MRSTTSRWAKGLLPILGLVSLIWFLLRVIPKPSRASYPCMRVAFPLASAFVVWLAGLGVSAFLARKARKVFRESRFVLAAVLGIAAVAVAWVSFNGDVVQTIYTGDVPSLRAEPLPDPVNDPIGEPKGRNPGRVVWVHDPGATDWVGPGSGGSCWDPDHTDQAVADVMMSKAIRWLAGESTDAEAWDALFRYTNLQRGSGERGYQGGEKIVVKLNLTLCGASGSINPSNRSIRTQYLGKAGMTNPQLVLALLRQLVNVVGVGQDEISVGDPVNYFPQEWYDYLKPEFPYVRYLDHYSFTGRTQVQFSNDPLLWSTTDADGKEQDYLPQSYVEADYLINFAVLKSHERAGITLCAKNHYGSLIRSPVGDLWGHRDNYYDLHTNLPGELPGRNRYRTLVDLMGHDQIRHKTLLYLLDGLYGGKTWDGTPYKWNMTPFNGDWPSSLFASQDPVAIDSVGYDFLLAEWPQEVSIGEGSAQDYLHEAALAHDPPSGTFYDPEGDGMAMASLGVHEHWNNPVDKQYSRNLGTAAGIELIAEDPLISPPEASIIADGINGSVPLLVNFDGSGSHDPDGVITSYEWDFGDGTIDSGETVSHTFSDAGSYTVKLTVTDAQGATDSDTIQITANPESVVVVEMEAEDMPIKTTGGSTSGGWNIWSNGYIAENMDFASGGTVKFEVMARGSYAGGAWPIMEVRIDQTPVGTVTVDSSSWAAYTIQASITSGSHEVAIAFMNDYYRRPDDRNLYVDKVTITASSPTPSTIEVSDFPNYRVFQRDIGGTSKSVTISGTCSNVAWNRVEARVLTHGTITPVIGWTTIDSTPGGETFSGNLTVPQGGWYNTEIRALDSAGSVIGSSRGTNKWGVGMIILCIGQSNMSGHGRLPFTDATSDLAVNYSNAGIWEHLSDPYDDGSPLGAVDNDNSTAGGSMIPALANSLLQTFDFPIAFVPSPKDGSNLYSQWADRNPSNHYDTTTLYGQSITKARTVGGVELIVMHQGEADTNDHRTEAQYETDFRKLIDNYREDLYATIPIFICQLGPIALGSNTRTDEDVVAVRNAQHDLDNGEDIFMAATAMDQPRIDHVHFTTQGLDAIGERVAHTIKYYFGETLYYRGPVITSASFVSEIRDMVDVQIDHRGGDDITPSSGITGFSLSSNGSPVTINSAYPIAQDLIRLTLASPIPNGTTVQLRYLWGSNPDTNALVIDNSSLGLPLENTTADMTVNEAPNQAPTVATAASASPSPVTGKTTSLSVLGADDGGEANLVYAWATSGTPPGSVTFSSNGTNAAKTTTATFTKAGSYTFQVTIKNQGNYTATSAVSVTVSQTLTAINVTPASTSVAAGSTQQFTASAVDQFGNVVSTQPGFTWSVSGGGTISSSGLFTAGSTAGDTYTVTASSGGISGTAQVTVTAANIAPTVATAASANPNPVAGATTTLSVLGADDGGEANLVYTWATSGTPPAAVTFSANGTNPAKTTTATFTKSGRYTFQVTIRDQGNLTVTSSAAVTVDQTLTSIVVSPSSATVETSATQQFNAAARDQFGDNLATAPTFTWSVSGGGTISSIGLFTAGTTAGGPYTVTAHSNVVSGTASVTVTPAIVYQINCGGSASTPYTADQYYSGGRTYSVTRTITTTGVTNPAPQAVYRTERYGTVTYTLPSLTSGASYKVRLHFSEIYWTATGKRKFNVAINGITVLSNYDIYAETGARYKAVVKEYTATANTSGQIVIRFTTVIDNAKIGGIEIIRQ